LNSADIAPQHLFCAKARAIAAMQRSYAIPYPLSISMNEQLSQRPSPEDQAKHDEPPPRNFLQQLGPGLITGASDDDPSGIATYSQAGAQFGYRMLWTMLFVYPLMAGIQEISALLGRVTGHGIAGNIRLHYSRWLLYPVVFLLLVANAVNLAADLTMMGAAVKLLVGGPDHLYVLLLAAASVTLQIMLSYARYANLLKWMSLALFAYVATAFAAKVDWALAVTGTLIPSVDLSPDGLLMLIAILGTTISPYLFFWQASGEVEELRIHREEKPLKRAPSQANKQMRRIWWDTYLGMGVSNLIAFFIIITAAATLNAQGKSDIQSAADAAEALRPVAGPLAFALFAIGIIGTGLLALPVLAGSAAYAIGEAMHWKVGLDRKAGEARGFYAVIAVASVAGAALTFTHFDPIKALFWTAVINGIVAGPLMVVMLLMTSNSRIMGEFCISKRLRITGWLGTALMILATLGLIFSWTR